MTWGMHAVAWLELGEQEQVSALFNRSFGARGCVLTQ
jgi:hypothetical protein